ncbi:DUF2589 domain-containing protein [Enterovibrio norvegicus]|uniref:DUF2589 domain-containing protein n=1 Tax=Enterovibrio norvegicus TaxID=188144 RepID=UPI0024B0B45E|nr:DUF2589 domain-containing protein [Enterovibrio norvegicus]
MPEVSNGPALVSMAQQFAGLPMRSLIGGPLNAAAQANSMMAVTQTKFMLDTCFNKSSDTKDKTSLTPIMVRAGSHFVKKHDLIDSNVLKSYIF